MKPKFKPFTEFRVELPAEDHIVDLAPRVRGTGDYAGEIGYALNMDHAGNLLVAWDDGGKDLIAAENVFFLSNGERNPE